MLQTLRRAGGSLVMTIPKAFIEQNHLQEGSRVELVVSGAQLSVTAPERQRLRLADLIAQTPPDLPMVEGWDEMDAVGMEVI